MSGVCVRECVCSDCVRERRRSECVGDCVREGGMNWRVFLCC